MGEGPTGGGTSWGDRYELSPITASREELCRGEGLLFPGSRGLGDLSELRKQMASPEWVSGRWREPRCRVTWVSLSKVWACLPGQHPLHPLLRQMPASVLHRVQQEQWRGVAVPSGCKLKSALCWGHWSRGVLPESKGASGAEEEGRVERSRSL